MSQNHGICVIHLARAQNDIKSFADFIDSYRRRQPGIEHKLAVIFKGFTEDDKLDEYRVLLSGLPYQSVFVDDSGFDIGPYFSAAHMFDFEYLCFLNSHSVIVDDGWLGKLFKHIQRDSIGIVGATGSYESMASGLVQSLHTEQQSWQLWKNRLLSIGSGFRHAVSLEMNFPSFPNHHIRTNAFMMSRQLMLNIRTWPMRSKMDIYRFESGKHSLTRQILSMNLRALVVGRDGEAYEKECWHESDTFRSGTQQNLLVSDNQTRFYSEVDAQTKAILTERTWGRRQSPGCAQNAPDAQL